MKHDSTSSKTGSTNGFVTFGQGFQSESEWPIVPDPRSVLHTVALSKPMVVVLNAIKRFDPEEILPVGDKTATSSSLSLYRISKLSGVHYPLLHKAVKWLKAKGIIGSQGEGARRKIILCWRPLGVLLVTEFAPYEVRKDFLSHMLGDRTKLERFLLTYLQITGKRSEFLADYLFSHSTHLINFFRQFFFIPYYKNHNLYPHTSHWYDSKLWNMTTLLFLFVEEIVGFEHSLQSHKEEIPCVLEDIVKFFQTHFRYGGYVIRHYLEEEEARKFRAGFSPDEIGLEEDYGIWTERLHVARVGVRESAGKSEIGGKSKRTESKRAK